MAWWDQYKPGKATPPPSAAYPPFGDYGPDPYPDYASAKDFYGTLRRENESRVNQGPLTAEQLGYDSAAGTLLNLRSGNYMLPIGYANLGAILAGQGKTDPRALNMQLTDISRQGATNQTALGERMAQMGLGSSGMGFALGAAQDQATQNARGRAIADENQAAEARKRTDLQLMYDMLIGPSLQAYGAIKGVSLGQQQLSQQKQADMMRLLGTLAVGAAGCWVARSVYGVMNPRWLVFRHWLFTQAPAELREMYLAHGPATARFLDRNPSLKPGMRAAMDRIIGG